MPKKGLLLLSGGLDSTALLLCMMKDPSFVKVGALSIYYGQRHSRELNASIALARRYDIEHTQIDISYLAAALFKGSSLTDDVETPKGAYDDPSMKVTVVPNRNMVMMSIAASFALSNGYDTLATAVHQGDHAIYPDCRPDFITKMRGALARCHYTPVNLHTPFLDGDKSFGLIEAKNLGYSVKAFEDTYSCYEGGEVHCGECGACNERKQAFSDAFDVDPTKYLK